ncbi:MAG: 4Fe-4S dicluster domain-containing protein [Phycisphaerae bacterium]|nr:4Fe-4S dicluster domain-containing protein [Phycisphaerae bacterium]
MLDRIITRGRLVELVDELARTRRIIGPVRRGERFFYEPVAKAREIDLEFNYCVYSPKKVLFPAREELFMFERNNGSFRTKPLLDERPTALIGVHPCDINAIRLLDQVFSHSHRDDHYLARRRQLFIIGVDCPAECTAGVFCEDMKSNEANEGFDLMCYPLSANGASEDMRYGIKFGTDAGREFLLYAQAGDRPTVEDERAFERYRAQKRAAFQRRIPFDVDGLPALLDRSYDSLLWEATARRCYSCGSCNLSCPTCFCFNTFDKLDLTLSSGQRVREWDGCQLREFATVAGGHNFRPQAASRLRHRIYRKGKWILEREGIPGCVGCARCDRACTAKINSVEIYNQLAEEG